jgi:hypothetical protein
MRLGRQFVVSPARAFCLVWLQLVAVLLTLTAAFNVTMDPYLVFGTPRMPGVNALKPETQTHTALAKDFLVARLRPVGLLLGDSKVDIGLDPLSPAWPQEDRPVFNDAVPGIRLEGVAGRLRRDLALGPVRRALLTVNPEELMGPAPPDIAPVPLESPWDAFWHRVRDRLLAALSLDAVRASLATLAAQGGGDVGDMSPLGATSEGAFRGLVAVAGYDALFVQKDSELQARLRRVAARVQGTDEASRIRLAPVEAIIAACLQNRVRLDIVIPPSHADYLRALDRAGLWPLYQRVKAALTTLVAKYGSSDLHLWDFGGFDSVSTEAVPDPGDLTGSTQWFWEPSHFKKRLGEKMLRAIYGGDGSYGVALTPASIDAVLATELAAKTAFGTQNPAVLDNRLTRAAR